MQTGQEEQEVVGNLLPHRGHHDQRHGLVFVHQEVPVVADAFQRIRHYAERGREHEHPQHARDDRCHGVGHDEQRLVDHGAAHDAVGKDRQRQRDDNAKARHQHREHRRAIKGLVIARVVEQLDEVVQPHPFAAQAEGIFHLEGLQDGLCGRPEKEDADDYQLGQQKRPGQPGGTEKYAFFHKPSELKKPRDPCGSRRWMSGFQHAIDAARVDCEPTVRHLAEREITYPCWPLQSEPAIRRHA
ncbi:hypothetical protein SDC9_156848 [bioreactor metagenome]|uniref:Uncharacterized protein n=1 Tax=bioreactor metagenome TaxID=1076179 RepID=A0A645F5U2_9ZZZZ